MTEPAPPEATADAVRRVDSVTIPARFNGPPGSANGGYACGLVAAAIGPEATVRLSSPPPLDTPLRRTALGDGSVTLMHGDVLVATGVPGAVRLDAAPPPRFEDASRASERFAGRDPSNHAFPSCFVCGPERGGDGLRLFPGPVGDDGLLACGWRPDPSLGRDGIVDPLFVWAALDCPSGFACMPLGTPTVLASMTAALRGVVHTARDYVVTAWPIASEGRKHRAGAALHDARDGALVAVADALWITLRGEPVVG